MKITQATLKAIIQEEVANMFEAADKNTGMSGVKGDDEGKTYMGHEKADAIEEDGFAPSHYCVHHGGVHHEGKIRMAEAVNHNYNRNLGRVTHYDMKLSDGTILENVAFEDIQVTNASLAEGHHHTMGKRDREEHDLDDLYAMVRDLKHKVDSMDK
jgi:hypothetical protein|tara:strand:+ start:108 stop:575 length:468 start_codon:yes stop_codon:yes gene_type:complete